MNGQTQCSRSATNDMAFPNQTTTRCALQAYPFQPRQLRGCTAMREIDKIYIEKGTEQDPYTETFGAVKSLIAFLVICVFAGMAFIAWVR